jgi:branched-chain amino acid transport system ATP-binding protein
VTWAIREKSYSQRRACRLADRGYVRVHGQIVLSADDPQALQQNELVRKYYLGVGAGKEKRPQP